MKKSVQLFFAVLLSTQLPAQNFTGQWKGQFTDKSTTFFHFLKKFSVEK